MANNWWENDKVASSSDDWWKDDKEVNGDMDVAVKAQPEKLSFVEEANRVNKWVGDETARLREINPGASLDQLTRLAGENYKNSLQPKAPPVDRVKQYTDKGMGAEDAQANAAFDIKQQGILNKRFNTAKPDERGDRIGLAYNPNTDADRAAAMGRDVDMAQENIAIRENAQDVGPVVAGFAKGFGQAKAFGESVIGFTGDAFGSDQVKQWGIDAYNDTMRKVGNMAVAKEFTEIGTAGEAADYLGETLSYGAFQGLQALVTGGVGGAIGQTIGKKALGEIAALAASNVSQEIGSIYGDAQEEAKRTGKPAPSLLQVASMATAAAVIDTVADKIGMDAVFKANTKAGVMSRIGAGVKQPLVQGGTEMAQKVPEEIGAGKDPFRDGMLKDYINEGAAGFVMGGGPGVIAASRDNSAEAQIARAIQDNVDNTTATGVDLAARSALSPDNGIKPLLDTQPKRFEAAEIMQAGNVGEAITAFTQSVEPLGGLINTVGDPIARATDSDLLARLQPEELALANGTTNTETLRDSNVLGRAGTPTQEGASIAFTGGLPGMADTAGGAILQNGSKELGDSASSRAVAQAHLDRLNQQDPVAYPKVTLGDPTEQEHAQLLNAAKQTQQLFGISAEIVPFSDTSPNSVNGIQIGDKVFVNTSGLTSNALNTGWHETHHIMQAMAEYDTSQGRVGTKAQNYIAKVDSVFDTMGEAGKLNYIANFLYQSEIDASPEVAAVKKSLPIKQQYWTAEQKQQVQDARLDAAREYLGEAKTRKEMMADFVGNRATDKEFIQAMAKSDPTWVENWLKIITDLLSSLRGNNGNKESAAVDGYVADLKKSRKVVLDAMVELRNSNGTQSQATEQGASFQAKQQDVSEAGFYSALSRGVNELPYKQLPAKAWNDALKSLVNKGKVKTDEIEAAGLGDWIALQDGKVTKEQVQHYLDSHGVQVNEVSMSKASAPPKELDKYIAMYGPEDASTPQEFRDIAREAANDAARAYRNDDRTKGESLDEIAEQASQHADFLEANPNSGSRTKYDDYQLPGGDNYREVLLTLPDTKPTIAKYAALKGITEGQAIADRTGFIEWRTEELSKQRQGSYTSSHWDQKNVLAHIRVNDRVDSDGGRVLFVEEIQSDAAQDKRKGKDVPDMPFTGKTEAWASLALKRIVKMAVDGGYDRVAFVNGEQSADRYSLAKKVDALTWKPNQDGTFDFEVLKDDATVLSNRNATPEWLESHIGKELAKNIVDDKHTSILEKSGRRFIEGDGLKVGGEGMKDFYDKLIPNYAKEVVRKLGGDGLKQITIKQTDGFEGSKTKAPAKSIQSDQIGFDITDKMREKVSGGVPLFQRRESRGVVGEVAPHPGERSNDKPENRTEKQQTNHENWKVQREWEPMADNEKVLATRDVYRKQVDRVMADMGLRGWTVEFSSGTFEGKENPNFIIEAADDATTEQINELANVIGYVLNQKAMITFDENNKSGENVASFVKVSLPKDMSKDTVKQLRSWIAEKAPGAGGDTLRKDALVYGNFTHFTDSPISDEEFKKRMDNAVASFAAYEGDIVVSDILQWESGYIEPETREDYLKGTRYGESGTGQVGTGGASIYGTPRNNRDWIEGVGRDASARRMEWINNSVSGKQRAIRRRSQSERDVQGRDFATEYGTAKQGSVSAVGVHFSKEGRTSLSSSFYGTGLRGAEADRLQNAPASIRNRIYFYVDSGNGIKPEAGVGAVKHSVKLNNLYDVNIDKNGYAKLSKGDPNKWEKMVKDGGFDGYLASTGANQKFAVLVGSHTVQVKPSYQKREWTSIEDIDDLGNFNLDSSEDDYLSDKEFDEKIAAELQQELYGTQNKTGKMRPGKTLKLADTTDKEIKAKGIHPEDAFPDLDYGTLSDGDKQAAFEVNGKVYLASTSENDNPRIIREDGMGSGIVAANTKGNLEGKPEPHGFTSLSEKAKQQWNKRIAASAELFRRDFDLLTAIPKDARKRVADTWKAIAQNPDAFEFNKVEKPTGKTYMDVAQDIANKMLKGGRYEAKIENLDYDDTIQYGDGFNIDIKDTKTGEVSRATVEYDRGSKQLTMHTQRLDKGSGAGKPVYQVGQAFATAFNAKIKADWMLLGVNNYRRTEQMFSGMLRSGNYDTMQPGYGQRIFGWSENANTPQKREWNMIRTAVAIARNVEELAPDIGKLSYDLQSGRFYLTEKGDTTESRLMAGMTVKRILADNDVRAMSVSRSTLARAAITLEAIEQDVAIPDHINEPVLYAKKQGPLSVDQWRDTRDAALSALSGDDKVRVLSAEKKYLREAKQANVVSYEFKLSAAKSLAAMDSPTLSTVALMTGSESIKVDASGKNGKTRVVDVARAIRGRNTESVRSLETEKGRGAIADALAHEALYAISNDGHAIGWYDRKVREAIAVSALRFPEILKDKQANMAFRMIAAITSNGQAVKDNFVLTFNLYQQWKETRTFPTEFEGGGARADAMVKAFAKMNSLVKSYGIGKVEKILMGVRSVRDIEIEFGVKISGEHKDTLVPTAVGMGGPKIGNFFANLSGHFDSPTMDLWFMRTIGRMTGGGLKTGKTLGKHLETLSSLLPESGTVNGISVRVMRDEIAEFNELVDEEKLDPDLTIETLANVDKWARARFTQFSKPDANGKTFTDKSPLNEISRTIKFGLGAMVEAPGNGTERNNLRDVVQRTLAAVEAKGIKLNAADLQAVLWYYEKNLYGKLGDISEAAKPWDYASAARYAVGREFGIVESDAGRPAGPVRDGQSGAVRREEILGGDSKAGGEDGRGGASFQKRQVTGLPDETRMQHVQRVLQDKYNRVKLIQDLLLDKGGVVGEQQDVYRAEERMHGRVHEQLREFADTMVKPLIDKAVKLKVDLNELAAYAYALHAKERNAHIQTINQNVQTGSGMSDDEADNVIQLVTLSGDKANFDDMHQDLLKITASTRKVMLDSGLITQDHYDAMENQYQNYVPLRGFDDVDPDTGKVKPGLGRGFNVKGAETIAAMGRDSKAGDIIENIVRDYERAVIRAERNSVGKTFLDLVTSNPDKKLWEVSPLKRSTRLVNGLVEYVDVLNTNEDVITVKVGGREVHIQVNDPLLLRAMENTFKAETSDTERFLMKTLGTYTSLLRNTITRYNPIFGFVNAVRDGQMGAAGVYDELGATGVKKYMANYAAAMMSAGRTEFNASNPQAKVMDRWMREMRFAGGTTGGVFMRDHATIRKEMRDAMLQAGATPNGVIEGIRSTKAWWAAGKLMHGLELIGSMSENAARLAAYATAREMGKTPSQAASIAKNLTVNFNRFGEQGQIINTAFLFYNASVQGSVRIAQMVKNPKVRYAMCGMAATGLALGLMAASVGGDDEDGQAYWDKIPDFEKERNLIFMLPPGMDMGEKVGTHGRYLKLPMAYGLNVFPVLGYQLADLIRHAQDPAKGVGVGKAAINLFSAVAGSYNPMGGSFDPRDKTQLAMAVSPTIVDAGIQLYAGVDSFGKPLGPQKSPYDQKPDSENVSAQNHGSVSHRIARWINEATGGNQARAGAIDIEPGTVRNVQGIVGGGLGKFIGDVVNLGYLGYMDLPIKTRDIPLVKNFYGEYDSKSGMSMFYERSKKALEEFDDMKAEYKLGIKREYSAEEKFLQSMGAQAHQMSQALGQLKKEEVKIAESKSPEKEKELKRRLLQARREKLAERFNARWYEKESALKRAGG